jgi:hypothetical protein
MNERIKQLADEAGLRFTQLMSNPMVPIVDGRETDLEKFAQLIVQECLDTIQRDNEGFGSANEDLLRGGRFTQLVAYRHIQARFGMGPYQDQESSGVES